MIKNKKIFMDIDGVLADFSTHFLNYFKIEDKSNPTKWDDERFTKNFHKVVDNEDFWFTIPRLINPTDIKFNISGYCTNRTSISVDITKKWLKINGFPKAPIYVCDDNKAKTLKMFGCDLFFDDNIENFKAINDSGVKCYLVTTSVNKTYNTKLRVDNINHMNIITKPTILILGHKRHGKTTLAKMICDKTKYKGEDSSMAASKLFIYDKLKHKYGYENIEECYEDRKNKRVEWYNLISDYNKNKKTRLAEKILSENNIYIGMRRNFEIEESIDRNLFDHIIGIFDPRKELESKDSFDIDVFDKSDYIIWNDKDLESLKNKVDKLF